MSDISQTLDFLIFLLPRKEVIHPQIPLRIPCYDLAFLTDPTLVPGYPDASGVTDSANLTGGVCKARERIHRDMLIHDY